MTKNISIGIVDDDPIFQYSLNAMIRSISNEISVLYFMNCKEAIVHLKNNINSSHQIPDILLLDIDMPVMDGWQFLDQVELLKLRLKKVPAIYLISSSDELIDTAQAFSYSTVKDFMLKPIFESQLLQMLNEVSARRSDGY